MDILIYFVLSMLSKFNAFNPQIKQNKNYQINDSLMYLENKYQEPFITNVSNYRNYQYYIELSFGSQKQGMRLILDSSSIFTWIPSSTNNQSINKYLSEYSSTFKKSNKSITIEYALGKFEGFFVSDSVFIENKLEIKEFNFILVDKTLGLEEMIADGVLGLGIGEENDGNISFVQSLYNQKIIDSPSFSIYLSENLSFILYGDISSSPELGVLIDKMAYCNVPKGINSWQCPLKSVSINKSKIKTKNTAILFDSGSRYIIIPVIHLRLFKQEYIDKVNTVCGVNEINQIICKCPSIDIFNGNLTLKFNGFRLIITKDQLISYDIHYEYECRFNILIDLNLDNNWILGTEGFKGVLFNFDYFQRKIRLLKTTLPDKITIKDKYSTRLYIWVLILVGIILFCIIIFACYRACKDNSRDKQE